MGWEITAIEKLFDLMKYLFGRRRFLDAIKGGIVIHGICEEIVKSHLSIDCFLLVMAYNGEGKFGFKKWSILNGSHNVELMPNFHYGNYVDVIMDFDHLQLMQRIIEKKRFGMARTEIEGESLGRSYDFERIKYTRFFLIKETKTRMYYVVAGTTAYNESLETVEHFERMRVAVNKIKNIVDKY